MNFTVIAMFENYQDAINASNKLSAAGFDSDHIDVSPYRAEGLSEEAHRTTQYEYQEDDNTGGFWDWLFGDDDDNRRDYSLVGTRTQVATVYTDSRVSADRAAEILNAAGAIDVNEHAKTLGKQVVKAGHYETGVTADARHTEGETLKVVEEDVNFGKRTIETGGVRIRSRIIEKPVSEKIRLKEERVYVTRTPVSRPATEADFNTFKEGVVEAVEHAEVAVVEKSAKVVEEVHIGKEVDTNVETLHETARKTEVVVEDIDRKMDFVDEKIAQ